MKIENREPSFRLQSYDYFNCTSLLIKVPCKVVNRKFHEDSFSTETVNERDLQFFSYI